MKFVAITLIAMVVCTSAAPKAHKFGVGVGVPVAIAQPIVPIVPVVHHVPVVQPIIPVVPVFPVFGRFG